MRLRSYEHLRQHLVYDHFDILRLGGYRPPGCFGHIMVMNFAITNWLWPALANQGGNRPFDAGISIAHIET